MSLPSTILLGLMMTLTVIFGVLESGKRANSRTYPVDLVQTEHWSEIQTILTSKDEEKPLSTSGVFETLDKLFGYKILSISKRDDELVVSIEGLGEMSYKNLSSKVECDYIVDLRPKNELVLIFEDKTVKLGLCNFDVVQTDIGSVILDSIKKLGLSNDKLKSMNENKNTFPAEKVINPQKSK